MLVEDVENRLETLRRSTKSNSPVDTIVLLGIEAHVCIVATCIDLIHRGFNVSNRALCTSILEISRLTYNMLLQLLKLYIEKNKTNLRRPTNYKFIHPDFRLIVKSRPYKPFRRRPLPC